MNRAQQAQACAKSAHDKFFTEGREAIVSFSPTLIDSLVAYAELNFRDQIAQEIAQEESSADFYLNLLRAAFISLFDAGTIPEVHPITSLGWSVIEQWRRDTGIGLAHLPAAKPTVDSFDALREQVRLDWATISADKVRQKAGSDPAYKRALDEMLESDEGTGATTFVRIPDAPNQNQY